jgi:hypothetical protein
MSKLDIKIPTPKGVLYAMYHQRDTEIAAPTVTAPNQETPTVAAVTPTPKIMLVKKEAHDMLGHINEKAVRKTAIALTWVGAHSWYFRRERTLHRGQGKTEEFAKTSGYTTVHRRQKPYLS